jgi:TPP-dependent trihydroxycyclohexane-1,2-dione (THcHDO) dehydratase
VLLGHSARQTSGPKVMSFAVQMDGPANRLGNTRTRALADGQQYKFFEGCLEIFGRGNVTAEVICVDFVANAKSLGACAVQAKTRDDLRNALIGARQTSVIAIETAYDKRVPSDRSWWDVPIEEVSESDAVRGVRSKYVQARQKERIF